MAMDCHQTAFQSFDSSNSRASSPGFTSPRSNPTSEAHKRNPTPSSSCFSSVDDFVPFLNRSKAVVFYGVQVTVFVLLARVFVWLLVKLDYFFLALAFLRYIIWPIITMKNDTQHISDYINKFFRDVSYLILIFVLIVFFLVLVVFFFLLIVCIALLAAFCLILGIFGSFLAYIADITGIDTQSCSIISAMIAYLRNVRRPVSNTIWNLIKVIVPTRFFTKGWELRSLDASVPSPSESADDQGISHAFPELNSFSQVFHSQVGQGAGVSRMFQQSNTLSPVFHSQVDQGAYANEVFDESFPLDGDWEFVHGEDNVNFTFLPHSSDVPSTSYREESFDTLVINSFNVPGFSIEIPNKLIIGLVKMIISSEVNKLFAGGTGINILYQGQKLEDDNNILLTEVPLNAQLDVIFVHNHPSQSALYHTNVALEQRGAITIEAATDTAQPKTNSTAKRQNNPFNIAEVEALIEGVEKFGTGSWTKIQAAYRILRERSSKNLLDKWKSMLQAAKRPAEERRGLEIPQQLLDRVLIVATQSERLRHGG